MKRILMAVIVLYQATRPLRKNTCRFYPSCSTFLKGCIEMHGVCRGIILGAMRLLRCHPLHPGGIDEVPREFDWEALWKANKPIAGQTPALMPGCIEEFSGGGNPRRTDLKNPAGNAGVSVELRNTRG